MSAAAPRQEPAPAAADDAPIDTTTIRRTIERALTFHQRDSREDLAELHHLLRGHIQLLVPEAEASIEHLWRGSLDWYQRRSRIDTIRHQAAADLADGILSARTQVAHMARDCSTLLAYVEEGPR